MEIIIISIATRINRSNVHARLGGYLELALCVLGIMARITELPNELTSDIDKCDALVSHRSAGRLQPCGRVS